MRKVASSRATSVAPCRRVRTPPRYASSDWLKMTLPALFARWWFDTSDNVKQPLVKQQCACARTLWTRETCSKQARGQFKQGRCLKPTRTAASSHSRQDVGHAACLDLSVHINGLWHFGLDCTNHNILRGQVSIATCCVKWSQMRGQEWAWQVGAHVISLRTAEPDAVFVHYACSPLKGRTSPEQEIKV